MEIKISNFFSSAESQIQRFKPKKIAMKTLVYGKIPFEGKKFTFWQRGGCAQKTEGDFEQKGGKTRCGCFGKARASIKTEKLR